jgi:RHS repeat-associated protein
VTDAIGNLVKKVDYDTFGNILADSNPDFTVPFGFAGGLHDRNIDLVRFGFRDYDPKTGRWTAKDPIGFTGGDIDLFGYVGNSPGNWNDPYGLSPVGWIVKLTQAGIKRVKPLYSKAEAVLARKGENNVEAVNRQMAGQIERAVAEGKDVMKHQGHELPDGSIGKPHFQTEGKFGQTFWGAAGFLASLLDPFDAISGELANEDELLENFYKNRTQSPCSQ